MTPFVHDNPGADACWRAAILFGRNSPAYKFALGEALLATAASGRTAMSLAELAVPYAQAIFRHPRGTDRQGTAAQSRFLDACRPHVRGEVPLDAAVEASGHRATCWSLSELCRRAAAGRGAKG